MAKPTRPVKADTEIQATVKAKELTFHEPPETNVSGVAEPSGETASGSNRTNLPDKVATNVVYRDIHVDFRVASRLTDPPDPE